MNFLIASFQLPCLTPCPENPSASSLVSVLPLQSAFYIHALSHLLSRFFIQMYGGRAALFPPLWAEGKYPEASSFFHWAHCNKLCRCFSYSARGWIFQLCPFFEQISSKHFTSLCIWYKRAGSPNDSSLLSLSYIPWLLQFDIYQAEDPPGDWKIKKWQKDSQTDNSEQL